MKIGPLLTKLSQKIKVARFLRHGVVRSALMDNVHRSFDWLTDFASINLKEATIQALIYPLFCLSRFAVIFWVTSLQQMLPR